MAIMIKVATDFSETPGARFATQGNFTGQEFRRTILIPAVTEAKQTGEKIIIDLDGTYGYPPSFLEEAFGGLAREFPDEDFSNMFEFITFDEPSLAEKIVKYIKNGNADAGSRR